mmetsp:Transcript_54318/g.63486  ORF Transcript_54318/g.63486 Transcript_54318/m.63486 type:complete len:89 (-) Transcript_54318:228-494(-)
MQKRHTSRRYTTPNNLDNATPHIVTLYESVSAIIMTLSSQRYHHGAIQVIQHRTSSSYANSSALSCWQYTDLAVRDVKFNNADGDTRR